MKKKKRRALLTLHHACAYVQKSNPIRNEERWAQWDATMILLSAAVTTAEEMLGIVAKEE